MQRLRNSRTDRLEQIVARAAAAGVPITGDAIIAQAGSASSVGRPHVARAMMEAGHVGSVAEAFERFLADDKPLDVPRYKTALPKAIELINGAGGVPVIAHPWARGSVKVLTPPVLTELIDDYGLAGLEIDHRDHGPRDGQVRTQLRQIAAATGCLVTGSSDFHGANKPHHVLGGETTSPEMFERLRQRLGMEPLA